MRNFGENFGVYISPVSLTRWISHRNHWKSSVAAHFMPWREIWFSEVLKSHFNVGGKTGKYCSGNLNLNPSSLHPLAKESLMGWCLEMTSRGKQDILPLCFGHRGTSVLLRGKEMMTQRNFEIKRGWDLEIWSWVCYHVLPLMIETDLFHSKWTQWTHPLPWGRKWSRLLGAQSDTQMQKLCMKRVHFRELSYQVKTV